MTVKKLNVKRLIIAICIFLLIIGLILYFIISNNIINSIDYKLKSIGYNEFDLEYIKTKLNDEEINYLLDKEYNENYLKLFKEKFFKFSNVDKYLDYLNKNNKSEISLAVKKVNTHSDIDFYDDIKEADTSKGELMLVNKVYKLSEDYVPEDLMLVPVKYSYEGKYVSKLIYEKLETMLNDALESGYKLVVCGGYRSYTDQEDAYESIKKSNGIRYADNYAARAGHSDYQTGLSVIIEPYNKIVEETNTNEEHIWLMENAHNYGFILRFPENTESITGFKFDPWRFRYVGVDAATKIKNENITFEEYYAFYIDKD